MFAEIGIAFPANCMQKQIRGFANLLPAEKEVTNVALSLSVSNFVSAQMALQMRKNNQI